MSACQFAVTVLWVLILLWAVLIWIMDSAEREER